jgi:crossover junction endodeoxyribonuclease RuvC
VSLVECGVIRTSAAQPLTVRIREIYEAVVELILRHQPFAMSVEQVFHGKNAQSALKLGHARGAILLAGALHDIVIAEYAPRQIKSAVAGTGNATKDQVAYMVKQQLRLKEVPTPHDAADGVAAALCHSLIGSFPVGS